MESTERPRTVPIEWLVRLRWFFLAGQFAVILFTAWRSAAVLAWLPLAVALTAYAASNVALAAKSRTRMKASAAGVMGAVLVVDTVLLTAVLASSGGAANPFTVLYLVHITLSAVVLSAAWTAIIAVLAVAGFGALFLLTPTSAMHTSGHPGFGHHLQGMWAAFILATVLTAFFVSRISRWLALQREQITLLREASAKNARLAALTTLAAGAAHELNSPLGTIAVAAHEAERRSSKTPGAEAITADLELIKLEVDRCQAILHRMAAQAAAPDSGAPLTMEELSATIAEQLGTEAVERIERKLEGGSVLPSMQVAQSVIALIRNALDASDDGGNVVLEITRRGGQLQVDVVDRGSGIPPDILDKIGEPFFTTKEPGAGLGLGVFLARAVVESRGGELSIESAVGKGTRATLVFPAPGAQEAKP